LGTDGTQRLPHCSKFGSQVQPQVPLQVIIESLGPGGHTCPQLPQLFTSPAKFTHEMLGSRPHSLGVVPPHVTPQVPLHVALPVPATGGGHVFPHPPQLLVSLPKLTQAPCAPSRAQRLGSAELGHEGEHALDAHDVEPFTGATQALPHPPQFAGSVARLSHAVGAFTGQPVYPVLQDQLHALLLHVGVESASPAAQTCPHALQFCGSLVVSTQVSLLVQRVGVGDMQPLTHEVPLHTGVPPEHETPQAPQLGDVVVLVSQPSSGLLVQCA
jgi:hypothetical protein